MAVLRDVTPLLAVTDLPDARRFFERPLGFACGFEGDGYAYMKRDDAAVRLHAVAPETDMSNPARNTGIYVDVDDMDGLFASMQPDLDTPPRPDYRPPFDQPYGQREFHVYYHNIQIIFGAPATMGQTP